LSSESSICAGVPAARAAPDVVAGPPFAVRGVRMPHDAAPGRIEVSALFANDAMQPSPTFVPLVVLTGEDGRELGESYGKALQLAAQSRREVAISVDLGKLAPGRYFVAVIPSHPDTGRSLGAGRYHVPLRVRAATPVP
jgi:uncharacterized sulfatase